MRGKPITHKPALTGLILTIAVAILAFYYVWHQTESYGRTIEGLQSYICAKQKIPPAECSRLRLVQQTTTMCCCEKQTKQRGERVSSSPFTSPMKGTMIVGMDLTEESGCPPGDQNCVCIHYCTKRQPQTAITQTLFVGIGNTYREACKGKSYERAIQVT